MKNNIQTELRWLGNKEYAARLGKYFKTGKGEYGEGDKFLGIQIPALRKIAKNYRKIPIVEASELLKSQFQYVLLFSLLSLFEVLH